MLVPENPQCTATGQMTNLRVDAWKEDTEKVLTQPPSKKRLFKLLNILAVCGVGCFFLQRTVHKLQWFMYSYCNLLLNPPELLVFWMMTLTPFQAPLATTLWAPPSPWCQVSVCPCIPQPFLYFSFWLSLQRPFYADSSLSTTKMKKENNAPQYRHHRF